MINSKMVRTGLVGVVLAAGFVIAGCASSDGSTGQQNGNLTGDNVKPACPSAGGGMAKSFSGRATAVSVRVDLKNPATTSWDGTAVVADTKALASSGGTLTKSTATANAGAVAQGAATNSITKGSGSTAESTTSITNLSAFHTAPDGFLKDILGTDGRGGTVAIDLQDLLEQLGINDQLLASIFTGPLAGGIQADVVQEDAKSWCDTDGAHSSATGTLANLVIGGHPIAITLSPNQKILSLPGLVEVTLNEQTTTSSGASDSSMDAAALHVNLLDGKIDVKIARAQAGVVCGGSDNGGGCGG